MRIRAIRWLGICTADWDRTVSFYRDALGFAVRSAGQHVGPSGVAARCAELALPNGDFIEVFDDNLAERQLFTAPVIGFQVDDVAAARDEMERKGVAFIGPVYRGNAFEWSYFRSPDGHVYELMAELTQV